MSDNANDIDVISRFIEIYTGLKPINSIKFLPILFFVQNTFTYKKILKSRI